MEKRGQADGRSASELATSLRARDQFLYRQVRHISGIGVVADPSGHLRRS